MRGQPRCSYSVRRKPKKSRDFARTSTSFLVEPIAGGPDIIWVETPLKNKFTLESGLTDTHTVRFF